MSKPRLAWWSAAILLVISAAAFSYSRWRVASGQGRDSLLAAMPADSSAVFFADFTALRTTQFSAELFKWAPRPAADADYAQFVRDTGFDYERDLDCAALAVIKQEPNSAFFVIADGHFNRAKIAAYALQSGTRELHNGREIFSVPRTGTAAKISFTFLTPSRLALASGENIESLLAPQTGADANDWRDRFQRLAGSPLFAVFRRDSAPGSTLTSRAPGGLQSPQLAALLDQLQWITVAGKPQADSLRIVAEGECPGDATARQLSDLLGGLLVLAQAGLNGPETRRQLDPQLRDAYLQMLKNADVSRIDRGETKSVRLIFDITPKFLDAAKSSVPLVPPPAPEGKAPRTPAHKRTRQKPKMAD